jgi:hypothetical protein
MPTEWNGLIRHFPWRHAIPMLIPDVVSMALDKHYAVESNRSISQSFLEKTIQVPLMLPSADHTLMTQMVYSDLDKLLADNSKNSASCHVR